MHCGVQAVCGAGEYSVQDGEQVPHGAVVVYDDGGELVATEPSCDTGPADVVGQPFRGCPQQGIPCCVAVVVVDLLEAVDVRNAWVRGFRERRDDEPTRLSALEAVSEAGSVRGIGGDRSWSRTMRE
ncbi:hypothetical protein ADK82_14040 [Streptomyces sp. NRRL S-4]|nr:hypothetical protein ADK82_14040 [Streptomyces sp. NRRL S-4]